MRTTDQNPSDKDVIIPAANFEVRSLKGVRVNFPGGYIPMKGWGIWDLAASGWVSLGNPVTTFNGRSVAVPYSLRLKKYAVAACSQGLLAGYEVIGVPVKSIGAKLVEVVPQIHGDEIDQESLGNHLYKLGCPSICADQLAEGLLRAYILTQRTTQSAEREKA